MLSKPISAPKLLEVANVTAHYGKVRALDDVSLRIDEGMIVGLIGANGAGKSTVLKLMSGLMRPTEGCIFFGYERIDHLPAHRIVGMGIIQVPEGRRLFTKMTVAENLRAGRYSQRERKGQLEGIDESLRYFPVLKTRLGQKAGLLSGGEQQMLAIARALMAKPAVLMLDEPTLGLAPMMSIKIGEIIADIQRNDISVVLAEQNARLALRVSQRAFVFETGRIVMEGSTEELTRNEEIKKAYL